MRKFVLILLASLSLTLGLVGGASAAPSNYPENPKACVGHSSTTANTQFQGEDPDKYRSDQARALYGEGDERGRKDDIQDIQAGTQCNSVSE